MNLYVDVDLHQAIQSPGSRSPASAFAIKMHDTPALDVYLVTGGQVQDYGAGTAMRFGLNLAAPAAISLLVEETTFTWMTDSNGEVFYHGEPNFDTSQLLAALGGSYSIQCAGEIRYQTPSGEIARTLDIPVVVYRAILDEVTFDATTANFTVPTIGASVSVAIGDTGWLYVGKRLSIVTAGEYTVASIIDPTHFSATNTGASGNAVATTVISFPQTVSSTPPTVPATYPAVGTLELLVHKGAANGYAELDSGTKLLLSRFPVGIEQTANRDVASGYPSLDSQALLDADEIPIDGTTLIVAPQAIVRNGTLTSGSPIVTLLSATADLTLGAPVTGTGIPGGTTILSIDSSSQIHLSANATTTGVSSLTFTSQKLSAIGPSLAVVGVTQEAFTVPAVDANVAITAANASLVVNAYYLIGTAGLYQYISFTDPTHGEYRNTGASGNAAPAAVIPFGKNIQLSAPAGPPGTSGSSGGISTLTTSSFAEPAMGATVVVPVLDSTFFWAGQLIFVNYPAGSTTGLFVCTNSDNSAPGNVTLEAVPEYLYFNGEDTVPTATALQVMGSAGTQVHSIDGFIETPTNKTYTIRLSWPGLPSSPAGTLTLLVLKLVSGTLTAALNVNGTGVSGATAISVTSSFSLTTISKAMTTDDLVTLVITSVSSPVDLAYSLRYI